VYRAFDRQLHREVALKLLRQASGRDLYRFKREFRALADIVHPNLVALHELHCAEGDWYFTMELVEGVSFIDWVRPAAAHGPSRSRQDIMTSAMDDARMRGALVQLIDALIALHKAGKLHRDLKPSNVLVTHEGRVVILDFGLAQESRPDETQSVTVQGTPAYMSPEHASGLGTSEASDWYMVGVMLFEAVTGQTPFRGSYLEVLKAKLEPFPPRPSDRARSVPRDLDALCHDLLQPEAARRPNGRNVLARLGGRGRDAQPAAAASLSSRRGPTLVGRGRHLAAVLRRRRTSAHRRT